VKWCMSEEREIVDFLEDAMGAMEKAERFVADMSYEDFIKDEKTVFAVLRAIEVIGEAVKHLPMDFRMKFPDIPWRDIAGMGDVLVHGYFAVDLETVWETIQTNIPKTKPFFLRVLKEIKGEGPVP